MSPCAVSIVVPTFRRPGALRATLAALVTAGDALAHRSAPDGAGATGYELIVVDDAGGDAASAAVTAEFAAAAGSAGAPRTVRCLTQARRGAATARNTGAARASGELLVFVDDDMIVAPDHLIRHLRAHDLAGPQALVAGRWEFVPGLLEAMALTPFGRFRTQLEQRFQAEARGAGLADGLVEMELLSAANLSLGRDLFTRLGGFDAAFPVAGAEDQDLSLRARAAGCRLVLDTHNLCLHNDHHADLAAYCRRERRSAQTMPFLVARHPARYAQSVYVRENRPLAYGDGPGLVAKKLVKSALSHPAALAGLGRVLTLLERVRAPAPVLERLYRALLGLHLFLGVRDTWSQAQVGGAPATPSQAQVSGVGAAAGPATGSEPSSQTSTPSVTATIVLHNSDEHLAGCLAALEADVASGALEVLAVDNASPDASAALLGTAMPQAQLIRSPVNAGFASGVNLSWPQVHTRYWMVLNPDVTLDAGALGDLVGFMDSHPQVAVAAPWLRDAPGEPPRYPGRALPSLPRVLIELLRLHRVLPRRLVAALLQGAYVGSPTDLDGVDDTGWVPGAAMIIRRDALAGTGAFDERFFMYGEDLELCWRLRRAGWGVAVCPTASATHIEGSSSRRSWPEPAVARRIAAGILQACAVIRGPGFAHVYGRLTWLSLAMEAAHPRRSATDRRRAGLVRDAWAAALRGA